MTSDQPPSLSVVKAPGCRVPIADGRVARGNLTPGLPQNPCVTVSRYTALAVLVIPRAGFTQSQWAKYRGLSAAASDQARMAFFQVRCSCTCSSATASGRC